MATAGNFWVNRYSSMDDNTTVSPVDHDSDFKLHDKIMNTSQELSRIYDSLVSKIKKIIMRRYLLNVITSFKYP